MNRAPLSPASALVAHAESLLSGGRVLLVGNAESNPAEHLLERGARLVQVLDADPRRVAQAAAHNAERRISYAPLNDSGLRDASFDCALVEDLALAADPADLVRGLRRAVGSHGLALIACSSDEQSSGLLGAKRGGLAFAAFSEIVHGTFERVLLVAQTPFVGYAVVHLDLDGPPEPALDNGFLTGGADAADFYIAIAGRGEAVEALEFEDMTIVQLPASATLSDGQKAQRAADSRQARRIEILETELLELRERSDSAEVERLSAELLRRETWIKQLELRAESADARADEAEVELARFEEQAALQVGARQELETLRERLDDAERVNERLQKECRWSEDRVRKLQSELDRALAEAEKGESEELASLARGLASERAQREAATHKLGQEQSAREKLERRVQELTGELRAAETQLSQAAEDSAPSSELALLEGQLAERGQAVLLLERQLSQLESYAKTLVAELAARGDGQSSNETAELEREISALAKSLAEREADLVAAGWMIGSLERRLQPSA